MRQPELRSALARELAVAGLVPEADAFRAVATRVRAVGIAERRRLERVLGADGWRRVRSQMHRERPEEDCARLLGSGGELTRFAVAPVGLGEPSLGTVASLGAEVNLIVALFDRVTEQGAPVDAVLPLESLERAMARAPRGDDEPLLLPLVEDYFDRLDRLDGVTRDPSLVEQLRQLVLEMYDAEVRTLSEAPLGREVIEKKNALPFVVAGLPAWLAPEAAAEGRARHLRWLEDLGRFLGWVDDAADLDHDAANGQPNQVLADGGLDADAIATQIAREGAAVLEEWQALSPPGSGDVDTFKVTVASWLEISAAEATALAEPRSGGAWT